jgi:hypothetical protein
MVIRLVATTAVKTHGDHQGHESRFASSILGISRLCLIVGPASSRNPVPEHLLNGRKTNNG